MENPELNKLSPFSAEADFQNRSKWLSNNLDGMNRSVEQMLKAIKENSHNFPKSADMDSQVEEFSRLYQLLVEKVLSPELQLQVPVYSDCGSPQGTPDLSSDQKQGFNMSSNRGLDISFDSGGGSSSLSLKDGTEFSSSSSSDSESESFNSSVDNNYAVSRAEKDGQGLQVEKMRVLELQQQTEQLKTRASESDSRIERLIEELEMSREMLRNSDDRIAKLTHELDIVQSDHHLQIKELETVFQVSQERFHAEKEQMQSDILKQVEAEKTGTRALHIAHETALQGEISQLKDELSARSESLAALNRYHDELKLKHDTLMAEKDELTATVHKLLADEESRESRVHELEVHLQHLQVEKEGLISGSESLKKQNDDLKLELSELQEEVNKQKVTIEDGAEGKREAIRQLCFSLDHYRSGYQELRQAFVGHKQRPVLTA